LRFVPTWRARTPPRPRNWGHTKRTAITALEIAIGSALLLGLAAYSMQGVAALIELIL
jgi:hypothetical protein